MVNKIIGDKRSFALDISINCSNPKLGVIRIWTDKIVIGEDEETFIKPNIAALSKIKNLSSYSRLDISYYSAEDIMNYILEDDFLYDQTLLGFGETFDDYLLRPYIFKDRVIILWSRYLNRNKGDVISLSKVNYGLVNCDKFYSVLEESTQLIG